MFGPWQVCGCGCAIRDHADDVGWFQTPGWCGVEFRTCRGCNEWEERRADEGYPTEPLGDFAARGEATP